MKSRVVLIFIFIFFAIAAFRCTLGKDEQPKEGCFAKELLLNMEDLSAKDQEGIMSPIKDSRPNSAMNCFGLQNTTACHEIIQYPSISFAEEVYQGKSKFLFSTDKSWGPWEKPDLVFVSLSADEYTYQCGPVYIGYESSETQCRFIARYGEYYIEFGMIIKLSGFHLENFEQAMLAIDKKMAPCAK